MHIRIPGSPYPFHPCSYSLSRPINSWNSLNSLSIKSEVLDNSPSNPRQLLHLPNRRPVLQELLDGLQSFVLRERIKLRPRRGRRHQPYHTQHLCLRRLRCPVLLRFQAFRPFRQRLAQQRPPLFTRQVPTSIRLLAYPGQVTSQPHILMPAAPRPLGSSPFLLFLLFLRDT